MKKKLMVVSGLVLSFAPFVAFAQTTSCQGGVNGGTLQGILCTIGNILNSIIPILVILGLVYFVWGVITYVIADDEAAKKTGRMRMIYGIIGLAVIVSVWGLVNILINTFGISQTGTINIPTVNLQ